MNCAVNNSWCAEEGWADLLMEAANIFDRRSRKSTPQNQQMCRQMKSKESRQNSKNDTYAARAKNDSVAAATPPTAQAIAPAADQQQIYCQALWLLNPRIPRLSFFVFFFLR